MKNTDVKVEEKKENNVISIIVRVLIAVVFIAFLVFIYNVFFNNNEYADLNDPDLIEIDGGYKKDINFKSVVKDKYVVNDKNGKKYMITCYDKDEKYDIEIGNYIYEKLDVKEEISVVGSVYYDEDGKKESYFFEVKSMVDEDDNGIIDIPDDYVEPTPERIPGVDYGDGVVW